MHVCMQTAPPATTAATVTGYARMHAWQHLNMHACYLSSIGTAKAVATVGATHLAIKVA